MRSKQIKEILKSTTGEREICDFLKDNPEILRGGIYNPIAFGHNDFVLHEFPFGSNYKSDFVVLMSESSRWNVNFIECEPVSDPIFTKELKPSNRLNSALSQIHDWMDYIRLNQAHIQRDLAKWCLEKDILKWPDDGKGLRNDTGDYLNDPACPIYFKYYIFIGRRSIENNIRKKMNQYCLQGILDIGTYDRFIDSAEKLEKYKGPNYTNLFN